MKAVKLLNRVQAVLHLYIILKLATIQEHVLQNELACNNCFDISLQFNINEFIKSVTIKTLSCRTATFYE